MEKHVLNWCIHVDIPFVIILGGWPIFLLTNNKYLFLMIGTTAYALYMLKEHFLNALTFLLPTRTKNNVRGVCLQRALGL